MNDGPRKIATNIMDVHGIPTYIERDNNDKINSVTWTNIEGCDEIKIRNGVLKKLHPYPADVFVIASKYIYVPEHLLGALKYASETINIDQLDVPKHVSEIYLRKRHKILAKVSGSCASITISVITIKFVEDMVKMYKSKKLIKGANLCMDDLYEEFREEYDTRINTFLYGGKIIPEISWYENIVERDMKAPLLKK